MIGTGQSNLLSYQTQQASRRRAHSSLLSAGSKLVKYYSRKRNNSKNAVAALHEKVVRLHSRQSSDFGQQLGAGGSATASAGQEAAPMTPGMVLVSSPVNELQRDSVSKSAMARGSGTAAHQKRQATAHNGRNREGSHVV